MKPRYRKAVKSASPLHYQKRPARSVSVTSPLLRQLNMSTLALVLFVALALLSTTRGKEPAARESAPAKATKAEVIIDNFRFFTENIHDSDRPNSDPDH